MKSFKFSPYFPPYCLKLPRHLVSPKCYCSSCRISLYPKVQPTSIDSCHHPFHNSFEFCHVIIVDAYSFNQE
ncbi:hypothetical protein AQUCO_01400678v1 [Aquilegia coerulea]|uniref:Uncharacterized protein n=1 Tax=Aquilegia coerulea TaxID=218851 RepID=A0A2G5DXS2_AQUCA|nr:hypothetical protein AQUCO_01400678v1 [Aquilegia coerulea]